MEQATPETNFSPAAKTLLGANLIGRALEDPGQAVFFLMGNYDEQVRPYLYYHHFQKYPENPQDLYLKEVTEMLDRMKSFMRQGLQNVINSEIAAERLRHETHLKQVIGELKNSSKPHPLGSVSELAQKFGVSKSEIRRRKADGTLEAFIAEKQG